MLCKTTNVSGDRKYFNFCQILKLRNKSMTHFLLFKKYFPLQSISVRRGDRESDIVPSLCYRWRNWHLEGQPNPISRSEKEQRICGMVLECCFTLHLEKQIATLTFHIILQETTVLTSIIISIILNESAVFQRTAQENQTTQDVQDLHSVMRKI